MNCLLFHDSSNPFNAAYVTTLRVYTPTTECYIVLIVENTFINTVEYPGSICLCAFVCVSDCDSYQTDSDLSELVLFDLFSCDLHCAEWKEFQVTFDEIFENSVTSAPFLIENETLGQETAVHNLSLEQREYNNNCDNGTPGNNAFNVNMSKSVISEPSESELNNERTESNLCFLESETSGQSQSRETNPLQNCSNTNTTTSKDPMNITTNKSNNNNNNTRKKRIRRSLPKKCTHDQTTPRPLQTCPTPEMMLKIKSMLQRKRMKQKTLASLLRVRYSDLSFQSNNIFFSIVVLFLTQ